MRAIISDFAVFITIMSMVLIDYALGIPSPKLQVPNEFKVSRLERFYSTVSFSFVNFCINLSSAYEYIINQMISHSQPEMTVAGSSAQ